MPAEDSFLRAAGADIVRAPEVPAARAGRRASRAGAPSRTTSWSARRRSGVSRRTLVMRWRRRRCRWGCRRLSSEGLSEDGRQRLRVIRQLAEHVVARMGAMAAAAWTRVASGLGALWK
ncbi:hypothetical protein PsYK624_128680 [Phanerochaete sordida]|uniref:Uncharacterized protein n=1 Tax=Phanerochaete sordida TaxID=48140 RepID=A0A9P3GKJ1_9APHY|nr:hypothetical protein PsYK624_128680 [Phanerochaete sordida]